MQIGTKYCREYREIFFVTTNIIILKVANIKNILLIKTNFHTKSV